MIRVLLLLLVAGCGYKGQLTRVDPTSGSREEVRAARAAEAARTSAALAARAQERPVRVDDLAIRLEDRRDDPFSLPPD